MNYKNFLIFAFFILSGIIWAGDQQSPLDIRSMKLDLLNRDECIAKAKEGAFVEQSESDSQREFLVNDPQYTLWYSRPAKKWEEALPIGNGRLGAMIYGKVQEEIIQLNEDSMYSGKYQDANNPEFFEGLLEVRELLAAGNYEKAHEIAEKKLICKGEGSHYCSTPNCDYGSYQTLGNLILTFHHEQKETNYKRKLDLKQAIATTEYEINDVKYRREIFSSYPEQVIVVRLTSDQPGQLCFDATLNRPENAVLTLENSALIMKGNLYPGGIDYETIVTILPSGGTVENGSNHISVRDANEVLIFVAASTTFREKNPEQTNLEMLKKATSYTYKQLKKRHIEDYQRLFNRCHLDLAVGFTSQKATSERLWSLKEGAEDPSLFSLYFNYGRYLLISSSRSPFLPANLQGIWSDQILTPWCGDFHLNINLQMNYWPAEITHLSECSDPLDAFIFNLEKFGQKTAQEMYHARGWVAHHISNIWGFTAPAEHPSWGLFPGGSAWLCRHLWDKYLFHQDKKYLEKIYPTLKGASLFYLDTLYEDSQTKYLLPNPSNSPENQYALTNDKVGYLSKASTIQLSLVRDIFECVIQASQILNIDQDYARDLEKALSRLTPYEIDSQGLLKEYVEDFRLPFPGHRHMSHLYGLYPACDSSIMNSQQLLEAAKKSLYHRWEHGHGQTGWNLGWTINLFARIQDKHNAYQALVQMLTCSTLPNLFDNHPPFQIDGNFGGVAGIAEMLLQSHAGEIVLLPSLPDSWEEGSVKGLMARGGLEVSIKWHHSQIIEVELMAHTDNTFHIRFPADHKLANMWINGLLRCRPFDKTEVLDIALQSGDKILIN